MKHYGAGKIVLDDKDKKLPEEQEMKKEDKRDANPKAER